MKGRIKQILKESEFDWVERSEGNEFNQYLNNLLGDWLGSHSIEELEPYLAELPVGKQKDFVETLALMLDDVWDSGKTEGYDEGHNDGHSDGYDEGYDEGRDSGHTDGYDEGHSEAKSECESEAEDKWQDGYDTGHNDGHSEGHSEGYSDAQDECEECD
jgi:flagellar biosynthesis/type III secretory pathway protein FliH